MYTHTHPQEGLCTHTHTLKREYVHTYTHPQEGLCTHFLAPRSLCLFQGHNDGHCSVHFVQTDPGPTLQLHTFVLLLQECW